jgi:hypothetical protein
MRVGQRSDRYREQAHSYREMHFKIVWERACSRKDQSSLRKTFESPQGTNTATRN